MCPFCFTSRKKLSTFYSYALKAGLLGEISCCRSGHKILGRLFAGVLVSLISTVSPSSVAALVDFEYVSPFSARAAQWSFLLYLLTERSLSPFLLRMRAKERGVEKEEREREFGHSYSLFTRSPFTSRDEPFIDRSASLSPMWYKNTSE